MAGKSPFSILENTFRNLEKQKSFKCSPRGASPPSVFDLNELLLYNLRISHPIPALGNRTSNYMVSTRNGGKIAFSIGENTLCNLEIQESFQCCPRGAFPP